MQKYFLCYYYCMKKLLILFLILLFLFPASAALSEGSDSELADSILAPYFIVVDSSDPSIVFYENGADERAIPGSTMKIMTCILILENCPDLDERVTVSRKAANMKDSNSLMHVIGGEDLSIRELLYGLMLESGNDAALELATHLDGSIEAFADRMNAKAEELGMQNTHFINASGAYKSGQFSTARDMAILSCYAMKNEMFRTIVSTPYYTVPPNQVRKKELKMINGNDLIVPSEKNRQYYPEAVGVKTGSTENGGKCLVSAASRNGNTVIAVMLGAKEGGSKLQRMNRVFRDSAKVLDKALSEEYSPAPMSSLPVEWELVSEQNGVRYILYADPSASVISLPNSVIDHLLQDPSAVKVLSDPGRLDNKSVGEKAGTLQIFWEDLLLYDGSYTLQKIEVPPTPEPVLSSSPLPSNTSEPEAETPSPMSTTRKMSGLLAQIPSGVIWGGAAVLAMSGGILVYSLIRKSSK